MNIIQQYEAEQIARLTAERPVPCVRRPATRCASP